MTKADIERVIGRPETLEDIENYPEGKSIWSYFPVSIRFDGELVDDIGIGFSWWDGQMPAWLSPQGFFPSKDTKMATVHAFLAESNIAFEFGEDGRKIRTSAGVWIFPTTEDEDTIMSAVKQCGDRRDSFDERFRVAG